MGVDEEHRNLVNRRATVLLHTTMAKPKASSLRSPHIDFYTGERLAMRGTAIGREASRVST
jgi:hypothetical protein